MKRNRNSKRNKKIRNLIVLIAITAIFLSASTYAWFIGMKTVNVSAFDVEIAAIDGLALSLNGEDWSDTVAINSTNFNDVENEVVYEGNTNSWGGDGLIPMSSVGKIDKNVSRLIMFEKGSLTTTPGGYRIMASQVRNTINDNPEQSGYVVFDLFVKNLSGNAYYPEDNELNEEAIYLTVDSEVKVASTGVANTGIENSVRVAFAQIGRVIATTTDVDTITGMTCSNTYSVPDDETSDRVVTGICRDAQIWEPNDTDHVQNAINWYNTSCLARKDSDLTLATSFDGACSAVENGSTYQTYAVSGVIDYDDQVDIYDGEDYNGWTDSIADDATEGKLMAYPYFTDTMKMLKGTQRPTFITLAPNSITKIRIYVYIEGQDVDNYDFASLGKKISVAFGFTKERYFDEDIDYDNNNTANLPNDVIYDLHVNNGE